MTPITGAEFRCGAAKKLSIIFLSVTDPLATAQVSAQRRGASAFARAQVRVTLLRLPQWGPR
ncbi:hypothetical protein DR64_7007 [Paraburkholderia xenovorans LB400]|nr:hypothetical protein DR64_7007 [Paraburkholderia xenovorans LB400]